jgi:hypothetical protein
MKINARALAAAALSTGLVVAPASPVFANTVGSESNTHVSGDGSTHTSSTTSALATGMSAPTVNVGTTQVEKGTVQYSNSTGTSDAFSVGTATMINAAVSASSTPDYDVTSTANFGVTGSTINQVIGTSGTNSSSSQQSSSDIQTLAASSATSQANSDFTQTSDRGGGYWWWNRRSNKRTFVSNDDYQSTKSAYETSLTEDISKTLEDSQGQSGTISGVFKKVDGSQTDGTSSNEVTVKGIGANNSIVAAGTATTFDTNIMKVGATETTPSGGTAVAINTGAGTASGSASGSVNTTASANANSSQYVSSFAQAY